MTAAGEWLRDRYAQCDDTCTADCGACKGQGRPPAPLVAGAIGRGLVDARDAYRAQLIAQWHHPDDLGPWDD